MKHSVEQLLSDASLHSDSRLGWLQCPLSDLYPLNITAKSKACQSWYWGDRPGENDRNAIIESLPHSQKILSCFTRPTLTSLLNLCTDHPT
jgi:hypothetical protein